MPRKPLPTFNLIRISELPPACVFLFYGGMKLTELGGKIYRHPFKPPAFHAAFHVQDGIIVNVNLSTFIGRIDNHFRSKYRIDALIYKDMTANQIKQAQYGALLKAAGKNRKFRFYDVRGYLAFAFRKIPLLNHVVKPSDKWDFCSDQAVDIFDEIRPAIKISDLDDELTAPWHLFEYAVARPDKVECRTLWVGNKFKS